jgi:hypothetical protein
MSKDSIVVRPFAPANSALPDATRDLLLCDKDHKDHELERASLTPEDSIFVWPIAPASGAPPDATRDPLLCDKGHKVHDQEILGV